MQIQDDPTQLYLELLKKTLCFLLWNDPKDLNETEEAQIEKVEVRTWTTLAHTMIGLKRMDNIQYCIEKVLRENVPGDLIETGVWRGGACIFMRAMLAAYRIRDRRVFVADSFKGVPEPNGQLYPQDTGDTLHMEKILSVSKSEVEDNFRKYGPLDEQVVFLEGWFKDTLPNAPIEKLSVMRVDGDMYESTMDALINLYPKLQYGGYCIIDDYALRGCRLAIDDFRRESGIKGELIEIDWTGVYWKKE